MDFDLDAAAPGVARVFAHFGLAVAKAQAVERLLAALVAYPDLVRLQTQGERNKAVHAVHRMTLSKLSKRFRAMGEPGVGDAILKEINGVRNMTVHRFFWEDNHTAMLASPEGQAELIRQLQALATRFDEVETRIRATMQRVGGLDFEYSSDTAIAPVPRIGPGE